MFLSARLPRSTIQIVAIHDEVAEMQPEPKYDGAFFGLIQIGRSHGLLEFNSRTESVHRAAKFGQRAVPGQLAQSPAMPGQCWFEAKLAVLAQARKGGAFVAPHQ